MVVRKWIKLFDEIGAKEVVGKPPHSVIEL